MSFDLDYNLVIRTLTIILLAVRFFYWVVTEKSADREKPKLQKVTMRRKLEKMATMACGALVTLQLLGLEIAPFPYSRAVQTFGFILVAIAFYVSIVARRELGTNWAHAADYQIKQGHVLVISGIYRYIRHPIYTGVILSVIGAELVAGSYLFVVFLVIAPLLSYSQAKKEEALLTAEFGDAYRDYMKTSHMFIPYIW